MPKSYKVGDTTYQFPDNYTDDQVTGILSKQGIIKAPKQEAPAKPQPGFWNRAGDTAVGIGKRWATDAASAGSMISKVDPFSPTGPVFSRLNPKGAQAVDKAETEGEKKLQPTTPSQQTGYDAGGFLEYLVPAGEAVLGRGAGTLARVGRSALRTGVQSGVIEGVQTKDPEKAAWAAGTGAVFGGAAELVISPLGKMMAKYSRKLYGKVLHPAGGKAKADVAKTLLGGGKQDIVGRGFAGKSADSLRDSAQEKAQDLWGQIQKRYGELEKGAQVKMKPIFDDVHAFIAKKALNKDGTVIGKEAGEYVTHAMERLKEVTEKLGPELGNADPVKLHNFRKMLDSSLYKPNALGKTVKTVGGAKDEVTEYLANSIRSVLNKDPTLGNLNKEFHFWQTAYETLNARTTADVGKLEFAKSTAMLGKAAIGSVIGEEGGRREGGVAGGITGAIAGAAFGAAMSSTAFKTVGAVTLDRIARLLATGEEYEAAGLAAKATAAAAKDPAEKERLIKLGQNATMEGRAAEAAEAAKKGKTGSAKPSPKNAVPAGSAKPSPKNAVPAMSQTGDLLSAYGRLSEGKGHMVPFGQLRKEFPHLSKEQFDKAAEDLIRKGKVSPVETGNEHRMSGPNKLPDDVINSWVKIDGKHYQAIQGKPSKPEAGGASTPKPEPFKPVEPLALKEPRVRPLTRAEEDKMFADEVAFDKRVQNTHSLTKDQLDRAQGIITKKMKTVNFQGVQDRLDAARWNIEHPRSVSQQEMSASIQELLGSVNQSIARFILDGTE